MTSINNCSDTLLNEESTPIVSKKFPKRRIALQIIVTILVIISATLCLVLREQGISAWRGFKAITTTLIVGIAVIRTHHSQFSTPTYQYPITIGLCCGLIGDIFLSYDEHRIYFFMGVLSFLIGHLYFVAAFMRNSVAKKKFAAVIILMDLTYLGFVVRHAPLSLRVAAVVYLAIISAMIFSSLSRFTTTTKKNTKVRISSFFTLAGSCLFFVSDGVLGTIYFYPLSQQYYFLMQCVVLITYWSAQLLIAYSI
ncbi:hypothetical protein P9112_012109 [Eukaryota sp. TZLM1-RC]